MALAFTFPGQGSQAVGMGKALAEAFPVARAVFDEVDAALGEKLTAIIWDGPAETLQLTENAQPALMAVSMAVLRILEHQHGLDIRGLGRFVAGHSLGEYSALVAAGALTLTDALPLVRFRAQAMQQAVPVGAGAMAAILGLEAGVVQQACAAVAAETGEVVEPANFNDPKQTVIAGSKAGVDRACESLKSLGAKRALPLAVSAPFHSSLMKPAALALRERLAAVAIQRPRIPVVNNIDVAVQNMPEGIRDALVRQAFGPVRWVEVIHALRARGLKHVLECGPGKVLAGLVKRVDAEIVSMTVHDPASLAQAKEQLA